MSSIYNLEPQPTASLVLQTTLGDLSVELFAKQTPITSRNFLQLCLDGYYDNTIFHRLVPGFIIQGGDPTGTGSGGECIYDGGAYSGDLDPWPMDQRRGKNAGPMGINFKDEFHSRLKFNRRGLLGMANESKPDTNSSQFFFTLDKAEELNGRNTVFGRIVGDTIYNLSRMGEAEVAEGSERPLYPIRITGVDILVNPFDDMEKAERIAKAPAPAPVAKPKKKNKQGKAGKKLLSFGDDEGDGEADAPVSKKLKFDTRIVMDDDEGEAPPSPKQTKQKSTKTSLPVREQTETRKSSSPPPPLAKEAPKPKPPPKHIRDYEEVSSPEPEVPKKKSALEQANEEIAALKASMRRNINEPTPVHEEPKSALESLIPETSTRGRKRRRGGDGPNSNGDLDLFKAFRSKLNSIPAEEKPEKNKKSKGPEPLPSDTPAPGTDEKNDDDDEEANLCDLHFIAGCQSCRAWDDNSGGDPSSAATNPDKPGAGGDVDDDNDDDNNTAWMSHALSFAADKLGKDLSYRKKAEEELIVIDPREKARTLQEEKRARRDATMQSTGREWDQARDQARNAKMARASALAGRGAK